MRHHALDLLADREGGTNSECVTLGGTFKMRSP